MGKRVSEDPASSDIHGGRRQHKEHVLESPLSLTREGILEQDLEDKNALHRQNQRKCLQAEGLNKDWEGAERLVGPY